MTLSVTTCRTSATGTAGAGQVIPFAFPITATTDIKVYKRVTATGVATLLTETTDYSVTIVAGAGGSVTLVAAAGAASTVHIIRDTPDTQAVDLVAGGDFDAETIEGALDKATKLAQEIEPIRSIRAPDTDTILSATLVLPSSVDRASKYLSFDASGNVTVTSALTTGAATFGALGTSIAACADEAAFKALVNLEAGTDYQTYSAKLTAIAALAVTDSGFIVGNGSTFVLETGATVLTSLGISAFAQTVLDDATAAAARATLGVDAVTDIVFWENDALAYEGETLTCS